MAYALSKYAVACCRSVLPADDDERCLRAMTIAERFADGQVGEEKLARARDSINTVLDEYPDALDAVSEAVYSAYFGLCCRIFRPPGRRVLEARTPWN
jgi:hypothetical protein